MISIYLKTCVSQGSVWVFGCVGLWVCGSAGAWVGGWVSCPVGYHGVPCKYSTEAKIGEMIQRSMMAELSLSTL